MAELWKHLQNDIGVQKVTWAASMVKKFRLVERPSRPTKTNISMSEMPVMMSGFVMGMSVTVFMTVRYHLERSLFIPHRAESADNGGNGGGRGGEKQRVFHRFEGASVGKQLLIPFEGKIPKIPKGFAFVKGKNQQHNYGSKKKTKIMPLYIFDDSFMLIPSVKSFGGEMLH